MILYTTHCPKCKTLQKQLDQRKKEYTVVDDINEIKSKGITAAPVLEINGELLDFNKALEWVLKNK